MKRNQDYNDRRDGEGRSGGRRDDARPFTRPDQHGDRRQNPRSDAPRPAGNDRPYKSFNRAERNDRPDRPGERTRSFDRDSNRADDRRSGGRSDDRPRSFDRDRSDRPAGSDRPYKPFNRADRPERPRSFDRDRPSGADRPPRFDRESGSERGGERTRPFNRDERPTERPRFERTDQDRPRSFDRSRDDSRRDDSRDERPRQPYDRDRPSRGFGNDRRDERRDDRPERQDRPRTAYNRDERSGERTRPFDRNRDDNRRNEGHDNRSGGRFTERRNTERPDDRRRDESGEAPIDRRTGRYSKAPNYNLDVMKKNLPRSRKVAQNLKRESDPDSIRLNRYIANAGVCSRREADELIGRGDVQVNGNVVTEMGYRVKPGDVVKYGNKVLNPEKMVYVLLNKPKDFITTTDDPEERNTVMDLVADAGPYRLYPVGRLDRNTTGLLLMTNDGELAGKLTHPSHNVKKVYQVELDKPISEEHFEAIRNGLELEDGFIKPDDLAIVTPDAQVVGVEIHSGRNRIVRRLFESQGYEVTKLDRTVFAGLTKKELPRGKWRFLEPKEVVKLKYLM